MSTTPPDYILFENKSFEFGDNIFTPVAVKKEIVVVENDKKLQELAHKLNTLKTEGVYINVICDLFMETESSIFEDDNYILCFLVQTWG